MTENEEVVILANRLLDEPNMDPDDDLRMLARQFLRMKERAEKAEVQRDLWIARSGEWQYKFLEATESAVK